MNLSISLGGLQAAWRRLDQAAATIARFSATKDAPSVTPDAPDSPAPSVPGAAAIIEASADLLVARLTARANRNALRAQDALADEIVRLGKR